jgi:protein TonB
LINGRVKMLAFVLSLCLHLLILTPLRLPPQKGERGSRAIEIRLVRIESSTKEERGINKVNQSGWKKPLPQKLSPKNEEEAFSNQEDQEPIPPQQIFTPKGNKTPSRLLYTFTPPMPNAAKEKRGSLSQANSVDDRLRDFLMMVRRRIEEKTSYPDVARDEGMEGVVRVEFVVRSNGEVDGLRMVGSSGYRILDEAAFTIIKEASPFPPLPEGRERLKITIPIVYRLIDG